MIPYENDGHGVRPPSLWLIWITGVMLAVACGWVA